jgi:sucrose-6-phosphate hydrolase SacC (GH32 family)
MPASTCKRDSRMNNCNRLANLVLLIAASLSATSCGGGENPGIGIAPDYTKLTATCFNASASNPVLTRGKPTTSFTADWNDPSVIKVGNQYWMYASSDDNFDINVKIYRLVSSDGLNWTLNPSTPVLDADPSASAWDHRSVETPSVVYFNGQYHMFYTGYPVTYTDVNAYRIGHATSSDGISWTRDPNNPVVAPTDPGGTTPNLDFNQWITAEPAAVVFNNKIYLYFSAVGANASVGSTLQVIGLTTSTDGNSWTTAQSVLTPDQAQYPRTGGTIDWLGYSTPSASVLNGQVHLFFDVVQNSPWKQLRLHHAKSANGTSNWTQDSSAMFSNTDFTWTDDEIRSPNALLDGTVLHLWFAGTESGSTPVLGIGHAKCTL